LKKDFKKKKGVFPPRVGKALFSTQKEKSNHNRKWGEKKGRTRGEVEKEKKRSVGGSKVWPKKENRSAS